MVRHKYISSANFNHWVDELAKTAMVFAPKKENNTVVYRPYQQGDAIELSTKPTESAKHILFPRSEVLFSFHKKKNDEGASNDVLLEEPTEPSSMVILGALPCDVRGFFSFDPVFSGSGKKGQLKDTYYLRRREKTVLISHACKSLQSTCFCHWVGGEPTGTQGADIQIVDITSGFVLSLITEKGRELTSMLNDASQEQVDEASSVIKRALNTIKERPNICASKESFVALFDNKDFWEEHSAACISCGACTYLCPTCYCFNITDETNGLSGVRIRSWDNCMSPLFTLEASGHNPRVKKASRLKNRVGHKFSYYPYLYEGKFSCVGCGRCIKSCPSAVDIRKIVMSALIVAGSTKEAMDDGL